MFWFLILSGLTSGFLTYSAQSPEFQPNFYVIWFILIFLRFFFSSLCSSSPRNTNNYNNNDYDGYGRARNHIAHRADTFNPNSSRYNSSVQDRINGSTARASHNRAGRNNKIVRDWPN